MSKIIEATTSLLSTLDKLYADGKNANINMDASHRERMIKSDQHKFTLGKRYIKVVSNNGVKCFVNSSTGDIYKAASCSAPAKGIRGNVLSPQNGLDAFVIYPCGMTFVKSAR